MCATEGCTRTLCAPEHVWSSDASSNDASSFSSPINAGGSRLRDTPKKCIETKHHHGWPRPQHAASTDKNTSPSPPSPQNTKLTLSSGCSASVSVVSGRCPRPITLTLGGRDRGGSIPKLEVTSTRLPPLPSPTHCRRTPSSMAGGGPGGFKRAGARRQERRARILVAARLERERGVRKPHSSSMYSGQVTCAACFNPCALAAFAPAQVR